MVRLSLNTSCDRASSIPDVKRHWAISTWWKGRGWKVAASLRSASNTSLRWEGSIHSGAMMEHFRLFQRLMASQRGTWHSVLGWKGPNSPCNLKIMTKWEV